MSVNETIDIGESLLAGSDDHVQVEAREHANNEPSLPHEAETLSLMESEEVVDPESDTAPVEVDAAVASDGGEEVEEEVAAAADQVAEPDARERSDKLHQLPLSRVKAIMKLDPEFQMASKEAAILIAKAAEEFVKYITEEAARITFQHKKKTVQPRDVAESILSDPALEFLDGAMDEVLSASDPVK